MGITKELAQDVLEGIFVAGRHLALFVGNPVDAQGNRQAATELSGGGYGRQELAAAGATATGDQATVTVTDNVARVGARTWFTANADVTGDPAYLVVCSGNVGSGSPDTTVLWSIPLNPDIDSIRSGTVISIQANAIVLTVPVP